MIRDVVILRFWNLTDATGDTLLILSNDIIENSFSIDYNCVSGDWYSPGDAVMSELNFTLLNLNGKYDNYNFYGERVDVHIVKSEGSIVSYDDGEYVFNDTFNGNYIPGYKGMFWVDTVKPHQKGENIAISALDGLSRLNIPFIYNLDTPFWNIFGVSDPPSSVMEVAINSIPSSLAKGTTLTAYNEYYTNPDRVPRMRITSDLNDRFSLLQILQYIANLIGCVVICEGGTIEFRRICDEKGSSISIPVSGRFNFKSNSNTPIPVTGIVFDDGDKTYYYHNGSTYTPSNIPDSVLKTMNEGLVFTADYTDLLKRTKRDGKISRILEDVTTKYTGNYYFYPFECDVLSSEYNVNLLDKVIFLDSNGNEELTSYITGIHYKLNGLTHIKCAGDYLSSAPAKSSVNSYTTQQGVAAMITDRNAVTLTMSSNSLNVGGRYTVSGFSNHSAFIITIKFGNYYGSVFAYRGSYGVTTIDDNIVFGNRVSYSPTTSTGNSPILSSSILQVKITDNGDDEITIDQCSYWFCKGASRQSDSDNDNCTIVKISAIS